MRNIVAGYHALEQETEFYNFINNNNNNTTELGAWKKRSCRNSSSKKAVIMHCQCSPQLLNTRCCYINLEIFSAAPHSYKILNRLQVAGWNDKISIYCSGVHGSQDCWPYPRLYFRRLSFTDTAYWRTQKTKTQLQWSDHEDR